MKFHRWHLPYLTIFGLLALASPAMGEPARPTFEKDLPRTAPMPGAFPRIPFFAPKGTDVQSKAVGAANAARSGALAANEKRGNMEMESLIARSRRDTFLQKGDAQAQTAEQLVPGSPESEAALREAAALYQNASEQDDIYRTTQWEAITQSLQRDALINNSLANAQTGRQVAQGAPAGSVGSAAAGGSTGMVPTISPQVVNLSVLRTGYRPARSRVIGR